jgi:hypothetical protein
MSVFFEDEYDYVRNFPFSIGGNFVTLLDCTISMEDDTTMVCLQQQDFVNLESYLLSEAFQNFKSNFEKHFDSNLFSSFTTRWYNFSSYWQKEKRDSVLRTWLYEKKEMDANYKKYFVPFRKKQNILNERFSEHNEDYVFIGDKDTRMEILGEVFNVRLKNFFNSRGVTVQSCYKFINIIREIETYCKNVTQFFEKTTFNSSKQGTRQNPVVEVNMVELMVACYNNKVNYRMPRFFTRDTFLRHPNYLGAFLELFHTGLIVDNLMVNFSIVLFSYYIFAKNVLEDVKDYTFQVQALCNEKMNDIEKREMVKELRKMGYK